MKCPKCNSNDLSEKFNKLGDRIYPGEKQCENCKYQAHVAEFYEEEELAKLSDDQRQTLFLNYSYFC